MDINEAILTLMDRAERWGELHEIDTSCDGYQPPEDTDTYYGHATCEDTRTLDQAWDAAAKWIREHPRTLDQAWDAAPKWIRENPTTES